MATDNSLGTGVYYRMEDYAGFMRRLLVVVIDLSVLAVACFFLGIAAAMIAQLFMDHEGRLNLVMLATWFCIVWLYLAMLKRSRIGTVAYWLLSLKIVNTKGNSPSLLQMTFRLMLWMFGPFNFVIDLLWLGADTEGQSLRDCYAGTYVVRKTAEPIGSAPIHLTRYSGVGMSLAYPRVVRPKEQPTSDD